MAPVRFSGVCLLALISWINISIVNQPVQAHPIVNPDNGLVRLFAPFPAPNNHVFHRN